MPTTLCPDDDALLEAAVEPSEASSVRAHIDSCADCRQRLQRMQSEIHSLQALATEMGDLQAETLPAPVQPAPVERRTNIGKYLIAGTLGEGGQAVVYRALHPTLGKDVVIKLSRRAIQPGQTHQLMNEGKILAKLDHPNLVRVFDLDSQDNQPYLVMEYIRGGDLTQLTGDRRPKPHAAATLVAQVARAVAMAHKNGITHQDIKPGNILVDEAGQPHLADFGLARIAQLAGEPDQQIVGGTPQYMAPEQARRDIEQIGPASDVYALGGVLYFLLVGKAPREGSDIIELLDRATRGDVNWSALETPAVPKPLAALCRRALAVKPADRPASADALAAHLEAFARGPRRRRLLMGVLTVLLAVLLVGYAFWPSAPVVIPTEKQLLVTAVERGYLPLHTGEPFQIRCKVPRGFPALVALVDSDGEISVDADFERKPAPPFDLIVYPNLKENVSLQASKTRGKQGSVLVLVCAGRSPAPTSEDIKPLLAGGPWPGLPGNMLVWMTSSQTGADVQRSVQRTPGNALNEVEVRLDQLRQQLVERYPFVAGVVVPHWDEK